MADPDLLAALPEVFRTAAQQSPPLRGLSSAADALLAPVARALDQIDTLADPYRAADHVAAALAWWVDLGWLTAPDATVTARRPEVSPRLRSVLAGGVPALRDLVAASPELSELRGTAAGIRRFLELATGVEGWQIEASGECHVVVRIPAEAADQTAIAEIIVAATKPAHVTAELVPLSSRPPDPPDPPGPQDPAVPRKAS